MTSAPVRDAGSLMNYVGVRRAEPLGAGAGSAESFGDVMSKTGSSKENLSGQRKITVGNDKNLADAKVKSSLNSREVSETESTPKTEQVSKAAEGKVTTEAQEQAVEEAGKKLVEEIAEKLEVSEEDVLKAMEMLGFDMAALLNAENLTMLAVTLSGEDSPLALLTNEGLYGTVQELLQSLDEVKTALAEELSLNPEELQQVIDEVSAKAQMPEDGMEEIPTDLTEQAEGQEVKEETNAKVTVTVDHGTKAVKLTTDESGNVEQVEGVAEKTEGNSEEAGSKGQGSMSQEEGKETLPGQNTLTETILQGRVQNAEVTFEQTQAAYSTQDTQEIMKQIMDYMKIQLKPGMDQLEMQLHPESLGNLHIQITSKGGEVTAQFHVQNEAVKAALESQIVELKDTLKEQGVKVEAVEVTVESHAFESNLWQGRGRDEESSFKDSRKSPRRINLNALDENFEEEADEDELLAAKMMEANGNTVDYTA